MLRLKTAIPCALLAAFGASAQAANLIANPEFTTDLSGWTVSHSGTANVVFDAASGSPSTGAIRLTSTNGGIAEARQCFTLGPQSVDLIVRRFIATSVPPITEADANIIAWDGANCTGSPLVGAIAANAVPGFAGFFNGNAQTWDELSALDTPLPVGTVSVSVTIYVNAGASGNVDYLFDFVRFGPTGTTPVTLQAFDVE